MVSVTKELNLAFYVIIININRHTWLVTAASDSTAVANFLQEAVI